MFYFIWVLFEFYILLLNFRSLAPTFNSPVTKENKYTVEVR